MQTLVDKKIVTCDRCLIRSYLYSRHFCAYIVISIIADEINYFGSSMKKHRYFVDYEMRLREVCATMKSIVAPQMDTHTN